MTLVTPPPVTPGPRAAPQPGLAPARGGVPPASLLGMAALLQGRDTVTQPEGQEDLYSFTHIKTTTIL